ncbi:MAG: tetratricopeptide repeat protein, partial [Anaerolineales bacterium]
VLEKMFPPVSDASEKGAEKQTSDYSHRTQEEVQAAEIDKPPRNYSELVKSRQNLPEIIKELEQAADKDPENPSLLRNLGDAYLRNNQVTEALEAYARAEKL